MRTATDFPRRQRRRSNGGAGLAFLVGMVALPFTTVVYGATLAKLWEWFITDTFGVRAISTAEAIGLSLVVTFVTYQWDAASKSDDSGDPLVVVLTAIFTGIMRAGLALAIGLVVTWFTA